MIEDLVKQISWTAFKARILDVLIDLSYAISGRNPWRLNDAILKAVMLAKELSKEGRRIHLPSLNFAPHAQWVIRVVKKISLITFSTMFFLNKADLDKRFKLLRTWLQKLDITEELRGWNWQSPPVEPPSRDVFFGVGDLAARYCKTLRDIYSKRIENVKPPPNLKMFEGIVYHGVATDAVTKVKSILFEKGLIGGADIIEDLMPSVENACERLTWDALNTVGKLEEKDVAAVKRKTVSFYRFLLVQAASQVDLILSKFPHIDVDSLVNQAVSRL